MLSKVITSVSDFIKAPFVGTVSPLTLFLATGMVLVFIFGWTLILYNIKRAGEELI